MGRKDVKRAEIYVDKILKGTTPRELPIEPPARPHLTIDQRSAKALGLTTPPELLLRAHELVD